jgi:DNA replication and repair protein RecF
MHLEKLQLVHFKNYENRFFTFSPDLNCILGPNGSGKTNLLDAIYFLGYCKSALHSQDALSIQFKADYMQIEGLFKTEETELIACQVQRIGKKTLSQNKVAYERFSDHIGKYPAVLILPDDTDLIRDGSETRRKLFDGILSVLSPAYLQDFMAYTKVLDQRNSLLKLFAERQSVDHDLINIYTEQLLAIGGRIHAERRVFIEKFIPIFLKHYAFLSDSVENVELSYISEWLEPDFKTIFRNTLSTDLAAQRTTKGIHKDDYQFSLNQQPLKKFGSQGQRKSFVMAVRMAQFEIITEVKGFKPILLLDDIFDKLDENRIRKLVEMIKDGVFSQIFLTDARPQRTRQLLEGLDVNFIETV